MAHTAHTPHDAAFDPTDPHGAHAGQHHGHVIVPARTIWGILTILLVFTILTVFAAQAEEWFSETFHVAFPQLLNVGIALSIAVVKSILVAMYFMQLKYDDPLNAIIFLFCLFAVGLFLFFAMTDLESRGAIDRFKAGEIVQGGTGIQVTGGVNTGGKPIVIWAREHKMDEIRAEVVPLVEKAAAAGEASLPREGLGEVVRGVIEDMKAAGTLTDLQIQKDLVITQATEAEFKRQKAEAHGHHAEHEPAFRDETLFKNRPKPVEGHAGSAHEAAGGHGGH